eukprot:GILK01007150.1.p1 GENE.GILK01007150.1~~GILK01007150.1.p1  ORF type:complete len:773 (+),score=132.97 GILK01007150.1:46-2319(+)
MEYCDALLSLQKLAETTQVPVLVNLFSRLTLQPRHFRLLYNALPFDPEHLEPFVTAFLRIKKWNHDWTKAAAGMPLPLPLASKSYEFKVASKLLSDFSALLPLLGTSLKPSLSALEKKLDTRVRCPLPDKDAPIAALWQYFGQDEIEKLRFAATADTDSESQQTGVSEWLPSAAQLLDFSIASGASVKTDADTVPITLHNVFNVMNGTTSAAASNNHTTTTNKTTDQHKPANMGNTGEESVRTDSESGSTLPVSLEPIPPASVPNSKPSSPNRQSRGRARSEQEKETANQKLERVIQAEWSFEVKTLGPLQAKVERPNGLAVAQEEEKRMDVISTTGSSSPLETVQRFLDWRTETHQLIGRILDHLLLNGICIATTLALAELVKAKDVYGKVLIELFKMSSYYVRSCLPLFAQATEDEPDLLRINFYHKTCSNLTLSVHNKALFRMLIQNYMLDAIAATGDVYLFPRTLDCHRDGVKYFDFSHTDPRFVLTAGYDRLLRIWDTKSHSCMAQFAGHRSIVTWCAFSKDDNTVYSASFDGTLKVWNAKTSECVATLSGHDDSIMDADISPDEKLMLSASMDKTVRLWRIKRGVCLRVYLGHRGWVKCVRFMPNGQTFASAGLDKRVFIWELNADAKLPSRIIDAHEDYILTMAVSSSDLLTASKDKYIKIFNWANASCRQIVDTGGSSWCSSAAFSPDGLYFAAASFDNSIFIYDTNTGRMIRQVRVHNEGSLSIAFARNDNSTLYVGTANGKLQIIEL